MATRKNPTALMKKRVQERVKKKFGRVVCEHCGKKPRGITLKYAHKNRRNYETTSTNLLLLCGHCHEKYDKKVTVRVHRGLFSNRVTRVKKKKPKPKVKKQKVGEIIVKKLKDSLGKLRSYKVKKLAKGKYKKTLVRPKKKVTKRNSGFGWF
ncbi:hypothetical protein JXB31_04155 [Candidatus Woesearchaeota archaeon]|nr:hypothetical protein [Candidatus Woesearchaeota archaeon]